MTEAIDRMAEAMADRAGFVWELLPERRDIVCGHGMPDGCRDYWRDMARVGLEAIREPTEAMGSAGLLVSAHDPLSGNEKMSDEQAERVGWTDRLRANPLRWEMPVWRAMVDEALKPHPRSP